MEHKLILSYEYSFVRYSHIADAIRQTISTQQAEVKSAITIMDKQLLVLESKLKELTLSSDD